MGLTVTLAGQDISDFVDESTIQIVSVLGQGPGVGAEGPAGQPSATFVTDLGPIAQAIGAGQEVPSVTRNVYSVNQSTHENAVDLTEWGGVAYTPNTGTGGSIAHDGTKAWQGTGSLKVQFAGLGTFESLGINVPVSQLLPGATYTVSAYIMGSPSQTPNLRFFIEGNDGIAGNHAISATTYHATPVSTQWTRYQISATMPAVFTDSYVGLRVDTGGTAQAITFWMDGLQFELSPSATSWHVGGSTPVPALVRQGEVIIKDATGTTIFGGYVTTLDDESLPVTVKTKITCDDYWQDLDRIEVNEVYDGQTDVFIIKDILTKYAPWIDQSSLPGSGTYPFPKRIIRATSVQQSLQTIANATGFNIWVGPDKVIHYEDPDSTSTAPFALSDNPDFVTTFGYDFTQYTLDDTGIINRVFFYGGNQESADFTQDLSPQANGTNKVFLLAYYPHNAADGHIHIKVSGSDIVVGNPFSTGSDGKLISQGGTAQVLLNADAETLTFDTAPTAAQTPQAVYRYNSPTVYVVSDQSSFQFFGRYFDGKIDDKNVLDADTAIQRCRVVLSEQSYGLESVKITTWQPGLIAGQIVKLTNALRGISAKPYIIQQVTTVPLGGGQFEYQAQLGAWNWSMIDLLVAAARRAGVQDNSTDENQTIIQAQETVEASTVAIVTTLTTTTSGNYYSGNFYSGFATIIS